MTATQKRYCISVMMADYYSAWIEADDDESALDLGIIRWENDNGDFHFDRSEQLSIDIVDWEHV